MHGLQLTADLQGCAPRQPALRDAEALRELCLRHVARAGLHAVNSLFHPFDGAGITGVVLLAESHVAVHTWPELEAVTLDVYVCNVSADNTPAAERLMASLVAAFAPAAVEQRRVRRGVLAP
jgi:S-adenosylmethionine decarboxylase proenzyme